LPRWTALVDALGDPVRLRMLRLLEKSELGVGELSKALQLPQSTVSRQLKPLLDCGFVERRTEGTASLCRVATSGMVSPGPELWALARAQFHGLVTGADDDARLATVLAERHRSGSAFFGRVGGEWDEVRRTLFGEHFGADALLALLDPSWHVADLGCGTGEATERIAPYVARVVAIDREPAMLAAARKRLAPLRNVEFREGDLRTLPAKDREFHAAVAMLVLHHVERPEEAVADAGRCLARGGRLLVVDMTLHDRREYLSTMGHVHLGFDRRACESWARAGGLSLARWTRLRPDIAGRGPGLFAALLVRER
jgi:ArsR family transcriptional regulator